ncbi:hypothetical protein OG225_07230 [Nocardia sp. NBC_01377]|uniref:hypothetical protein n=1 Tax=Nocardia sp. NBC_01377 TaxID=2903595 RepID=UPI0032453690
MTGVPEMGESVPTEHQPQPTIPEHRTQLRPTNEIPTAVAVQAILLRTDDIAVAIAGARAYRHGVELHFQLHVRPGARCTALGAFAGYPGGTKDQFLIGLEFADGRTVTNWPGDPTDPDTPTLMASASGGSTLLATANYYLTPLPPPGRLSVIGAWPARQIAEHRIELDTDAIRQGAATSTVLWPQQPDTPSTPLPTIPPAIEPDGWFARTRPSLIA